MKIKDTPKIDRPQEKLIKYGPQKLSDAELLAIVIRTGVRGSNVVQLSKKVLKYLVGDLNNVDVEKLTKIKGLGAVKACQIIASLELCERLKNSGSEYFSPKEIFDSLISIRQSKKEHFVAIYLNSAAEEITREIISIGTLDSNLIHPRELFEPAVKNTAASVIIAHNHPTNDSEPSSEDLKVTECLIESGKIMGIPIFDHIIVSKNNYFSFRENSLI